eukprot:Tbor_TRINITY_DN1097_c0_g1::TRINITY_DN1097_c0_g1_i1::g.12380::m.12380
MAPIVFLFSDDKITHRNVKYVAQSVYDNSSKNGFPDTTITEISNYRAVGFPRSAIFVFFIGSMTPSAVRFIKMLKKLQGENRTLVRDGVRFAILGADDKRVSSKFNACALELEMILLEIGARKIHPTGLVNTSHECNFDQVVSFWTSQLWESLKVKPSRETSAYIDEEILEHSNMTTSKILSVLQPVCWDEIPNLQPEDIFKLEILFMYCTSGMA